MVNTLHEATINAFGDHGETPRNTIRGTYDDTRAVLSEARVGLDDVTQLLEEVGVQKFADAWAELLGKIEGSLAR